MATLTDTELSNKKLAAGLTGIFLGFFGVHKFILAGSNPGYMRPAVIMLVVSLAGFPLTCGFSFFVMGVIGLIEGIIYLTKTNAEFQAEYLDATKGWF